MTFFILTASFLVRLACHNPFQIWLFSVVATQSGSSTLVSQYRSTLGFHVFQGRKQTHKCMLTIIFRGTWEQLIWRFPKLNSPIPQNRFQSVILRQLNHLHLQCSFLSDKQGFWTVCFHSERAHKEHNLGLQVPESGHKTPQKLSVYLCCILGSLLSQQQVLLVLALNSQHTQTHFASGHAATLTFHEDSIWVSPGELVCRPRKTNQ